MLAAGLVACSTTEEAGDAAGDDSARSTPQATASSEPSRTAATVASSDSPTARTPTATPPAVVVNVVDGDTLDVEVDGARERVRLILIDTPEVTGQAECFGREASDFVRRTVTPGTQLRLEKDVTERDRFNRLLRYVYLPDGRMLNELVVDAGYAVVATFPPDVRHEATLREAERRARDANRGLWTACRATATPPPVRTQAPALPPAATQAPARANCHPSYPDVCIPPPPPDLDCPQIPYRNIRVLPPDPHRLDGNDNDGVGCER